MTQVKICGMREIADALDAARAGADFIGVVLVPGRRRLVSEDQGLRIATALREQVENPPRVVGLFADQPLDEVEHAVKHCGLDLVQLCGDESLSYCSQISTPVIKVLHVSEIQSVEEQVDSLSREMAALRERGHMVILDRKVEGLQGGTGQSFNWEIAKELSSRGFSFLLAGGLTPENVGLAVRTVRPWGVDVSSGVETGGVKDGERIRAFIEAVRPADIEA